MKRSRPLQAKLPHKPEEKNNRKAKLTFRLYPATFLR